MNQKDIIDFFDSLAPTWDADMIRDDRLIATILDKGGVEAGKTVLDVACGTGVLFGDYLERNVASVTGVDISSQMVKIAATNYPGSNISVVCADVQEYDFGKKFDCIMIYNAFPHFPEPDKLFARLSQLLKAGGRVTVAHGMSRAHIDAHHKGSASKVSVGLMEENALAELMGRYLTVDTVISDDEKYIVSAHI